MSIYDDRDRLTQIRATNKKHLMVLDSSTEPKRLGLIKRFIRYLKALAGNE